jgi:hypothetical protein
MLPNPNARHWALIPSQDTGLQLLVFRGTSALAVLSCRFHNHEKEKGISCLGMLDSGCWDG